MTAGTQTPILGMGDFPPLNLPVRRFSVAEYHALMQTGILHSGDPVELIEGVLVNKMTKHPPHAVATELARDELGAVVPAGWCVCSQEPITTEDSEPEPDHMVVRGKRRDYLHRHPHAADVVAVIEVSDVTLARDRGPKKRLYARAQVPVYWIVNLVDRQIEVYTDPTGPADLPDYRQLMNYGETESVPLIIDGREAARIDVRNMLP